MTAIGLERFWSASAWSQSRRSRSRTFPSLVRKKLMVATALVNEPELLLLDEPVGGLTPTETDEFIDFMCSLKQEGLTIVFIEHVMRFLTALADRALIMHQGRIIFDGDPGGLGGDQTVREVYLGSAVLESAAQPAGAPS